MNHHAYFYAGDIEEGVAAALSYGAHTLGLSGHTHPDILVLRYTLLSVEEARQVSVIASRTSVQGGARLIVIAAPRIFHEAQNALLKIFEEPPSGTYLVLVVPSRGTIIETLHSRLLPLPIQENTVAKKHEAENEKGKEFLQIGKEERQKIIEKILERAKSDKPEEKQQARVEALALLEDVARAAYAARAKTGDPKLTPLLEDLTRLIPILHERSAPLKPILEHLLIASS